MEIFRSLVVAARQMIPEEKIQEVLQATDIVELIESHFPIKRAGTQYRALCPFHSEKTPSFNINPQLQIFKCFGCGKGGNAIAFVREHLGLTFPEAVKHLCQLKNIPFEEGQIDAKDLARQRAVSKLKDLHNKTAEWFHSMLLKSQSADHARSYLKGRGINSNVARRWQIGYAPSGRPFLEWAESKGFGADLLVQSGLAAPRDENFPDRGLYARFRDRVMFPIVNEFGDVIAFSGRILDPHSKLAKYMNSPETPLFVKSKTFFGFDKSRSAIMKAEQAVVCEGQLDLITCFEFGLENVIAPLGTAFTKDHARAMKRFAKEVVLCFDADDAGYGAAEKSYVHLSAAGVIVRVADMPAGQDPDSLIRSEGIEQFRQRVDSAKQFWDYQIDHLSAKMDLNDPRNRIQFANILATTIAHVEDKILQEEVVHTVATRLRVPASDFRGRVGQAARRVASQKGRERAYELRANADAEELPPITAENTDIVVLCKLALSDPETRDWLSAERARIGGVRDVLEADLLIRLWEAEYDVSTPTGVSAFLTSLQAREEAFYTELLMKKTPGTGVADARRSLRRLEIRAIQDRIELKKGNLRAPGLADSAVTQTINDIMALKKELVEKQKQLSNSD